MALRWVPPNSLSVYDLFSDIGVVVVVLDVPLAVHKGHTADLALLVTAWAGGMRTVGIAVLVLVHIFFSAAFASGRTQRVAVRLMRARNVLSVGFNGFRLVFHTLATDWRMHCWLGLSSSSTSSAPGSKSRPLIALRADAQDGCGVQLSEFWAQLLSTAAIFNAVRRHVVQWQDDATPAARNPGQNLSSALLFDHLA